MSSSRYPQWLDSALFYQVYPQSFQDSNADGIGDLPGLISRLDYIASLGCNAIWLNPCFVSPFLDAGYDVEDYYHVAPRYGTDEDLVRLVESAREVGIRVCLDLVPGHTAMTHPWFVESCRNEPGNPRRNWYVWTEDLCQRNEAGLSMIRGLAPRQGSFAANFFYHQPALNYGFAAPDPTEPWQLPVDHPDVLMLREEMRRIMRHWLDVGVAGFRVDMASSLIKGDKDYAQSKALWQEMRGFMEEEYPEAVLISEWGQPSAAIAAGFHVDFMLFGHNCAYDSLFRFERGRNILAWNCGDSYFDAAGKGDIRIFLDEFQKQRESVAGLPGFISVPSGNHDLPRLRYGRDMDDMEVIFAFLLTLPGIPFIYYGDEIGMRYLPDVPNTEGGYIRTGARTPMQWDRSAHAGFSDADMGSFYLPIDSGDDRPNVADQEGDSSSMLNRVRALTQLRQKQPALGNCGDFQPLFEEQRGYPFIYRRTAAGADDHVIAINPSAQATRAVLTEPVWQGATVSEVMARNAHAGRGERGWEFEMGPKSYLILKVSSVHDRETAHA